VTGLDAGFFIKLLAGNETAKNYCKQIETQKIQALMVGKWSS